MSNFIFILKVLGSIFLMLLFFPFIFDPNDPYHLAIARFFVGFWQFLVHNVPLISWNADQWVPGLGAFLIAWCIIHRWLSRWAKRTNRHWSLLSSFSVVALVPVLFVISFIVPGVLLNWDALIEVNWVEVW